MSTPFFGKQFTFTQPDGTPLQVMGWGDQNLAVFETLEGFTLVQDPVTGAYQYARASADGDDLQPLGVEPGKVLPQALGIAPHIRTSPEAARARAREGRGLPRGRSRWEQRREQARQMRLRAPGPEGIALAPPQRQTVGDYAGLCLLIDFPDVPGTITREQVDAFCNRPGYTEFGNRGSVYDYFHEISGGRLRYTNIVAPYYRAKHPRKYYTNESVAQPKRTRELIKEALDYHRSHGFDFSALTADDGGFVYAVNVFYAGPLVNKWAKGLWPHSYHLLTPYPVANGKAAFDYQITSMGSQLTLGTFCHENGHLICDFPDLYDYGNQSNGVGVYCLMCAGANVDERNPAQVGAYLKYQAGWASSVTEISNGLQATLRAGSNDFFILHKDRPSRKPEYFLIENRSNAGRDASLPGSGLAIWHVDESGSNEHEEMTAKLHYECSLKQADGHHHLERRINQGDPGDLYRADAALVFGDTTSPNSRWWDGTPSGLEIAHIGASPAGMTFVANLLPLPASPAPDAPA